jgi:hypothetical protein
VVQGASPGVLQEGVSGVGSEGAAHMVRRDNYGLLYTSIGLHFRSLQAL